MGLRRPAVVAALCGTAVIAGWLALARFDLGLFQVAAAPVEGSPATAATAEVAPADAAKIEDAVSLGDSAIVDVALPAPMPPPETASERVASLAPPEAAPSRAEAATPVEASDDCHLSESCIERELWS